MTELIELIVRIAVASIAITFGLLMLRITSDYIKHVISEDSVSKKSHKKGAGLRNWLSAQVINPQIERPSNSISEGLASKKQNGRIYAKFESAWTEKGMF